MKELFIEGGLIFMGTLTIVLLVLVAVATYNFLNLRKGASNSRQFAYVKHIGLFGFILGIFFQLISLSQMFEIVKGGINVSPAIMAGGLKVSLISTEYGAIIFLIAYLLWFGLNALSTENKA